MAHQKIRFRERRLLELERATPYLEKLANYPHTCLHHDIPQGADWLENLILANGIPPDSLLRALITIADKVEIKTNTLAIIGPANTGKTLFIKLASTFLRVMKKHKLAFLWYVCVCVCA